MKLLVSVSVFSLSGNLFQKSGAADAKARSPYVQVDEVGKLVTVCWRREDFVEVSKELKHWPGKLGIYEIELCGTKEQFYILFSYLQVASASVSTWALLDLFSLHVQQVLQHNFELIGCQKGEHCMNQ